MGKKESYEDFLLSEKSFCGFLIRQREESHVRPAGRGTLRSQPSCAD